MSEHSADWKPTASRTRLVVIALLVVTAGAAWADAIVRQDQSKPAPAAAPPPPADAKAAEDEEELARVGEELTEVVCRQCHPVENITRMRRTVREWADVITTMQGRGANATEDQFETIHKYLSRYYGLVAVNTASAQDLSAVLGLTAKDAQAIVAYRKANGKFTDLAALSKVEGIDKAKLEEQPEALRFQ